jgi:hypothetical protein
VPFRVFMVLCGIVPIAFGYGINSNNRYFFTAFKISEFHLFGQPVSDSETGVSLNKI